MSKKLFMKPLKALASPGIYLFGKYNQYKRERQQAYRSNLPAENELSQLNVKIDKLLNKLNGNLVEIATSPEEECVICVNAKAVMQTYPCGHRVVCRRCFVKTIQIALAQRTLPLCCVICRTKILRLKHTENNCRTAASALPSQSSYASRRSSKRSSDGLLGKCTRDTNPWPVANKYSRSLPGINAATSLRFKSSVNRSHSAVVYRHTASSTRKCCRHRSCSSISCSSSDAACIGKRTAAPLSTTVSTTSTSATTTTTTTTTTTATNAYRATANCAGIRNAYGSVRNELGIRPDTENRPADVRRMVGDQQIRAMTLSSREKLIRQFQRDFKEGQFSSGRPSSSSSSARTKSPLQKTVKRTSRQAQVTDDKINAGSKSSDPKQSNASKRKIFDKLKNYDDDNKQQDKTNKMAADKQNVKTGKLMKLETRGKSKLFRRVGKNFKTTKKEKITERKATAKKV